MTAPDNALARLADRVWLAASDEGLPDFDTVQWDKDSATAEFLFKAGFVAALQLPMDNPDVIEAIELARSIMAAPGVSVRKA